MKPWLFASVAAVALLLFVANRRRDLLALADSSSAALAEVANADDAEPAAQSLLAVESLLATLDPLTYWPTMTDEATEAANVSAFLWTIRCAEGTAGSDGYRTMFGGRKFASYADHPRNPLQFVDGDGRRLWSSAAGAYQFLAVSPLPSGGWTKVNTWDRIADKLGLPDFSPSSQDAAAVALINEAGALNDVRAGRFGAAVEKVRRIWASLPGAGYAQPERSMEWLESQYMRAGGVVVA